MAQSFPTTAKKIYDVIKKLSDDEVITLGKYIVSEDTQEEEVALAILSPGERLPSLVSVEGIECIIQDTGNFTKTEYVTEDAARLTIEWSVFLVSWDKSTGADMQVVAETICSKFYGSEAIQTVATDSGLGAKVQTKLIIRSDMPIV